LEGHPLGRAAHPYPGRDAGGHRAPEPARPPGVPVTTPLPSLRHQRALNTPTGIRRRIGVTLNRAGQSVSIEPTAASFTQDARRSQRWSGSMTVADPALVPSRPQDLLTPFGTEVAVTLGVEL